MTDRPILFSAPMVRALIEGRKTQTRRVLKVLNAGMLDAAERDGGKCLLPLARFAVGDRLWVRESWLKPFANTDTGSKAEMAGYIYRADGPEYLDLAAQKHQWGKEAKWKVSIHMPREASRLTLPVTEVRVQRLQDINLPDALNEGVTYSEELRAFVVPGVAHPDRAFPVLSRSSAREMYAALWDVINGSGAWLANPWVVASTFAVEHRNIDAR